jgi:DNA polymerase (family 10)
MGNDQIAEVFLEMADLLEFAGESPFRIRAYRQGAQSIRDFPESLAEWVRAGRDLTTIEGIGDTLAEKTKTLVSSGELPQLVKLRQQIPPSLRELLQIPGLGAKKVASLFRELGVRDLQQLRLACLDKRVRGLKGFGVKTEQAILAGLAIAEQANRRMTRDQADQLVESLRTYLQSCPTIERLEFAGSYRRGKETVGDIDILAVSRQPAEVMNHFLVFPGTEQVLAQGETKSSLRVGHGFQVDLRVVPANAWGAALQYFTGSKEHNVVLRGLAKKRGWKLNEYGLFAAEDETQPLSGSEEADIYQALGLPWIAPEFREDRFEWRKDWESWQSELVNLCDIHGDLHMHTTASDGEHGLEQMAEAAQQRGLQYIAITDHSQRVSVARGLDSERLLAQWSEIERFNRRFAPGQFLVLKGVECDILESGEMDLPDEVLAQADWVMASIHFGQKQPPEQLTDRLLRAIRHPAVSAIAHPTGRLLGRREGYKVDLEAVYRAAAEGGKFLEINANPWRLDLNDIHCMAAAKLGCQFVINTDAHSLSGLGLMKYGILVARRAGLARHQIFNCKTLDQMNHWRQQAGRARRRAVK